MRLLTPRYLGRALRGVALTAAVLFGGAYAVNTAHAAAGCRSDPIVMLSNGVKLDLTATLANDTLGDINSITYTIHAPAGASITQIVYTGGAVGPREHVIFYADNAAQNYNVTTYVDTKTTGVSVTATASAVDQTSDSDMAWSSATGYDHQYLATYVQG